MKKYIFLALMICSSLTFAQLSTVLPLKPVAGDSILIRYNPAFPTAVLSTDEPVYARITTGLSDGTIKKFHFRLLKKGTDLSASFVLPATAASFKVAFYTLNKDDDSAAKERFVYEKGRKKTVKSAFLESFFNENPDSIFRLEITTHPDNYIAYARYINVVSMINDAETSLQKINVLLEQLNKVKPTEEAEWLGAKCLAFSKTGRLTEAKALLLQLFESYPESATTAFAFSIYNYEYYKQSSKIIEDDVREKLKNIFIHYPDASVCADANIFEYFRHDKSISTTAFERVLKPRYERGEISYYALGNLPELYIKRAEKTDSAEIMLTEAIRLYQSGEIQHQFRLKYGHYQTYVPLLLLDLARVNELKGNYTDLISHVSAAMQILQGGNMEGNLMPEMLRLRAKAFSRINNYNLALEDYKKLWLSGSMDARDSIKQIFPLCDVKQLSFDEFMAALKPGATTINSRPKLADFTGTDLNGNIISLKDLRGKLVVINVWGIGCGPCIAEMPLLNELVKDYAGHREVVFIAVTADSRKDLLAFFKHKKFDYTVLGEVKHITDIFNTNALPVHIVIGREGEIINRSVGASEDITSFLKNIIDLNL